MEMMSSTKAVSVPANRVEEKLSASAILFLHLLPGAWMMALVLLVGYLLEANGYLADLPVLFAFVAPFGILLPQLSFLYYKGWRRNGKLSLQGVVLYRDHPMPFWKLLAWMVPALAWIAFVFFIIKPPVNQFFLDHFFGWMPAYLLDTSFTGQHSAGVLKLVMICFPLSISIGGAVEELYFRGYLLPRMAHLGGWAPVVNIFLFSLYHFWSPWENVVRWLAIPAWVLPAWRTQNLAVAVLIHFVINLFSGISLSLLILRFL